MKKRLALILAGFALLAAACGAGSDDAPSSVAAGSDTASPVDDAADAEPVDAEPADAEPSDDAQDDAAPVSDGDEPAMNAASPIGAYFADDGGFEAAVEEYNQRVQEEIVLCMAEQGFEFKRTSGRVNDVQQRQGDLTMREWTKEYGYGISTSFDSIAQAQASDPNAGIVLALSAGERDLWIETLAGEGGFAAIGDFGSRPLEEQGCIGQSIIATGGEDALAGIDTFGSAYEEGEEGIYDRPEMVTAVDAWSRCMAGAGHPDFGDLDDPEDEIQSELSTITAPLNAAIDELDPEEGRALVEGDTLELENLPGLDVEALRALQDREVTVAIADLDCYEGEVQAIYEPLRDDFERGLLEEYATEFAALRNIGG